LPLLFSDADLGEEQQLDILASSSLLEMVRELSKKTDQASKGRPGTNYPLCSLFSEPVHTGVSRRRSQG